MVACSGGADSLALAMATRFVAERSGYRCGLVTIDHGLQEGSTSRAAETVAWAEGIGLAPALAASVDAAARPGGQGPEATARQARYAALAAAARQTGASAVLLGHTQDDQAETVLLALARGSGPRGLSGMPQHRLIHGIAFLRPLLDVPRAVVRAACLADGLRPWEDPHNIDPSYARARARAAMPLLIETLGPGLAVNLARTAGMLAADVEFLEAAAARAQVGAAASDGGLLVAELAALAPALRRRVLHRWCLGLGAAPAALSSRHIEALDALVTRWHGQKAVHLPTGVRVIRRCGQLERIGRSAVLPRGAPADAPE
ncbi:MAG: tRNA lysidine(34) synthetase TilS [Micromonosporaceae bacterium]|nr:tRNA lysidine(34) synthetase TilS [Micromonosporaceae bacterium]